MGTIKSTTSDVKVMKDTLSATHLVRGVSSSEDFVVTVASTRLDSLIDGTPSTNVTVQDSVYTTATTATKRLVTDVNLFVPLFGPAGGQTPTLTSSNNSILTFDSHGRATFHAAGTCTVDVLVPNVGTRRVTVTATSTGGQTVTTFSNFASGSLGSHLVSTLTGLVSGHIAPNLSGTPPFAYSSQINLYTADRTARNTSGWWSTTNLSCFAVLGQMTAISPRDGIVAAHRGAPAIGTIYYFMGQDNITYTSTVAAQTLLTSPVSGGTDIRVVTFASDLPATVKPAKLLPANHRNYLPNPANGYPVIAMNQDFTVLIHDLRLLQSNSSILFRQPTNTTLSPWWYMVRGGDSGCGIGMLINNEIVFVSDWAVVEGGPNCSDNITQINTAMAANGSPYSVTTANLSGFTSY